MVMENPFEGKEIWFGVGSQDLYGEEALRQVAIHSAEMVDYLNNTGKIPAKIVLKPTLKSSDGVKEFMVEASANPNVIGVITWCHTFSPAKMWIRGLEVLTKPLLQLATQHHKEIPWETIDMDFMNLNQAAHGDREFGYIVSRLGIKRKVVVGHYTDPEVAEKLGTWARACAGWDASNNMKVMRWGDNMRNVAVTEGDKVETQIKLGWQVDYWPVGHLVETMDAVTEAEVDAQMEQYKERYDFATDDLATVRYQAREEVAMRKILEREGAQAFINNFQDLYGMEQLPGLASQNMMADGIGYGGEGDWKVAGMTAIMKKMAQGLEGGTLFMEDYTYDLEPGKEVSLGAHMLEVCPSIAAQRPRIEVHPLGIGGKNPPARLVFEGKEGPGIVVSLIDMGGRLRMIIQDIEVIKPILEMPNLPVARVMWKPMPDLLTGVKCWIQAGGAHHTVLSTAVTAEMMEDWAEMMQIECVHITKDTTFSDFKKELFYNDIAWKLKEF